MHSKKLTKKKQKVSLRNKFYSFLMGWDRVGNGISPCFFAFLRGGIWQAIPKSFLFFREIFLLLVYELFRAHEMRSQLEVTEMLECKVNLTV